MIKFLSSSFLFLLACLLIVNSFEDTRTQKNWLVKKKLKALSAQSDSINTLFMGSSVTYRNFDPVYFDSLINQRMKANISSFNLGLPGASLLEIQYILQQVLANKPANLRTLILEVNDISLLLRQINSRSSRYINYHNFQRTTTICNSIITSPLSLTTKLQMLKTRIQICFSHYARSGDLHDIWKATLRNRNRRVDQPKKHYLNYFGYDGLSNQTSRQRTHYLSKEGQKAFQELLANAQQADKASLTSRYTLTATLKTFYEISQLCQKQNINIIVLNPPANGAWSFAINKLKTSHIPYPIIELNLPEKYPALFATENRFDIYHLNTKGAALATETLAELLISENIDF